MDTDQLAVVVPARSRRWTGVVIFVVMTVAVAVVTAIAYVAVSSTKRVQAANPLPPPSQEQLIQPSPTPAPNRAPLSTPPSASTASSTTTPTTTTTPSAGPDLKPVTGPAGLVVSLPPSWPVHAAAIASNREATDPDETTRLIRFGGNPSGSGSLFDITARSETGNTSIANGYHRIHLDKIKSGSATEAVNWEFTFIKNGKPTHARGVYWRLGNTDYVVYTSSSEASWAKSAEIFESVLASAKPR